ncbi:hypothetical protein CHLRE_01g005450v5 [Chlamydomonas reinhardtii]|uniref:Radial spoke protein 10 n=1 Tax=Chlamydomonas reinhardtii TaxID=3055 RepID=Q27YU4_CHLRE|nr:uncharacterized protein CHLRE_01g005450v5 [Chlamydomonas reinhardtii]7JR9_E Chain E, Radial spoke protein 10 [Chlamydomonas reinhardtii]7JRJ_E Chain E, Radial spoke protein 10 [Chlamydomonas reinhardtii]7JTK_S Chain S, Flagellar radial spoke protein 10 [Chlamydomonas reinhardtii]7JTK_T Chain T, Flagellar radial spoke protein 10 [Chlamydomonas reinhardtii]8GLV_IO Chain IO, Radial spoke protein 10 [Chlamydomonas reinhardtii]8GLV_IP Chain IP, Radial spoke protein 10 [Chlamydomonas reinhardtii|eukprot:XP_001702125.1 radial spoke protein 10 [Chlamydomonas reinhardtii]
MADDELPPQPVWEGPLDEDGKPHGLGKMEYPPPPMGEDDEEEKPGDKFEGTMEHGVRTGKGTYTWGVSGAVYTGDYVNGKKHGKGKMVYPDKGVYEGDWVEDVMQGQGTYTYPNGDIYQGAFWAGKRHGKGMYHYKGPCCQLVGDWADGGFTYGRWVYADGSMFMGKFGGAAADSKPTAGSYFYSSSSLVQEGHFAKDGSWVGHRDPAVGKEFSVA